jgi:lipopolysaccharide/colanic/teichoic acid biosynthesis glycosyltransferase
MRTRPVGTGIEHGVPVLPRGASTVSTLAMRMLDVVIAGILLVVAAPILAVIALLVRASGPGPVLFRQRRIGYREHPFTMLKFRTMHVGCDDKVHRDFVTRMLIAGPAGEAAADGLFKLADDPRVTRIGGFLRRTSLDELPQLLNVLRGEMSLVGPRPALPWEVDLYEPHHRLRFQVRPGMTGLWQVKGRNRVSIARALDLDVDFVTRQSVGLYLWILALTAPAVLRGDGAR